MSKAALWILIVAFALAGPLLSLAPLGIAPLLFTAALIGYASERIQSGTWPRPPPVVTVVLIILLIWCAISLIWALNPGDGARKLIDLAAVAVSLAAMLALADRVDAAQRRQISVALVGGIAVGLILLAIETQFDFPLYRAVMGNSDRRLVGLLESKRAVDALPLLVWPACLALARLKSAWLGILLAVLFTGASVKLTASSATLGMMFSLVVFAASCVSVAWVHRLLALGTVLAFILIIPVAIVGYDHGGTHARWLKHSAQHRVEIWHFAAEKTLERPLLGYGFNASRYVPNGDAVSEFLPPGQSLIPLHPHDGFLQILLEIGVIGAIIAAASLLAALRAVGRWPAGMARFTLAGYAAGMVIAGLAFGIWQTWWMATLAFSAVAYRAIGAETDHG